MPPNASGCRNSVCLLSFLAARAVRPRGTRRRAPHAGGAVLAYGHREEAPNAGDAGLAAGHSLRVPVISYLLSAIAYSQLVPPWLRKTLAGFLRASIARVDGPIFPTRQRAALRRSVQAARDLLQPPIGENTLARQPRPPLRYTDKPLRSSRLPVLPCKRVPVIPFYPKQSRRQRPSQKPRAARQPETRSSRRWKSGRPVPRRMLLFPLAP